jgi:hypothetical protein
MRGNLKRRRGRPSIVVAAITGLLMLVMCGQALAAGTPVTVGAAPGTEPPSVAVQTNGSALIAWSTKDTVEWCVLPQGAAKCSTRGTLPLAGGENEIGAVQAIADGSTSVILANAFGNPAAPDYDPLQMWVSTDNGATFAAQAGGVSVGSGIINGDTVPVGGTVVPGTAVLGFGWETAIGAPSFDTFGLTNQTECSGATCATGFATLEPASNPDQVGNLGARYAANLDGVMGMFETNFTSGPLGCSPSKTVPFGTAFAFGDGNASPSNDYNVSPGLPNTAWRVPVTQLDCNVEFPALGAGPSGFGVLEQDDLANDTIYHRFSGITNSFSAKPVVVSSQGEQQPSLSQDSAGGVYAAFLSSDAQGPISLAYSANGGDSWTGPAPLAPGGSVQNLTSNVNASGQGFAAWLDGGSIHAQSFDAQDAVTPATVAPTATSTAGAVTVDVSCAAYPCTITLTLTAPGSVVINAHARRAAAKPKHPKQVTLGAGTFKVKSAKKAKALTVKLNAKGRRTIAGHQGTLKLQLGVTEKALGATVKSTRNLRVKLPKAPHHKKR